MPTDNNPVYISPDANEGVTNRVTPVSPLLGLRVGANNGAYNQLVLVNGGDTTSRAMAIRGELVVDGDILLTGPLLVLGDVSGTTFNGAPLPSGSLKSPIKLSAASFQTSATNPGVLSLGKWIGGTPTSFWASIPIGGGNTITDVLVYVRGNGTTAIVSAKIFNSSNTSTAPVQLGTTQSSIGSSASDQVLTFAALNHVTVAGHSYIVEVSTASSADLLFGADILFT